MKAEIASQKRDAIIIPFNTYTAHYYSQSSAPWEAAYINCFAEGDGGESARQAGVIILTYPDGMRLPGQENASPAPQGAKMPSTQINHIEQRDGKDFFVIYYHLDRFDDVINLLRFAVDGRAGTAGAQNISMFVSADPYAHVWALCNNLHVPVGGQYGG